MAGSCGAFCSFCGKCGRRFTKVFDVGSIPKVAPPGTDAGVFRRIDEKPEDGYSSKSEKQADSPQDQPQRRGHE